jgi:hypothetical protein
MYQISGGVCRDMLRGWEIMWACVKWVGECLRTCQACGGVLYHVSNRWVSAYGIKSVRECVGTCQGGRVWCKDVSSERESALSYVKWVGECVDMSLYYYKFFNLLKNHSCTTRPSGTS